MNESSNDGNGSTYESNSGGRGPQDGREELRGLLRAATADKPFNELYGVTFDHRGAILVGDVLLDALQASGLGCEDFDMVGALTAAAVPLVDAMIHAAARRGYDIDAFMMDFVYPSIKGPSIAHRRVVLLDAWLSEQSYVQTSSLVTLRNGNELSLDFSVVRHEDAEVVAIAALIGGAVQRSATDRSASSHRVIKVIDTIEDQSHEIPFVPAFTEDELRGSAE